MKFINKLHKFMYGRYGPDDLYKFLFKIYVIMFLINIFLNNRIITLLELLLVFIIFYRFFSKQIYQRSDENKKFLKFKNKILRPFVNIKRNINDKNHIYKKCRKCKTVLKLPLPMKKGIQHAKCPECKRKVTLFTLKSQKVEIIKKKEGKIK